MDAINLALLDSADEIHLDAQVFARNLSALRLEQPEFAAELEKVALPRHWRPAQTLDGAAGFRTEPPGAPPQWLGGAAAPNTRAAAILNLDCLTDKNPALLSVGAELTFLLRRLSPRQAVYVFEPEEAALAAILRLCDISADIESGRCILAPPNREREFLAELLRTHEGLLPPGAVVPPPNANPAQLQHVQRICEEAASNAAQSRDHRYQTIRNSRPHSSRPSLDPRLAVIALGANPSSHRLAKALAEAGGRLGWETCTRVSAGPRDVHPLPHAAALVDFEPSLTVCIDHNPAMLRIDPAGVLCEWRLSARDLPDAIDDSRVIQLAASPRISELLRAAGAPSERIHDFYWGHAPASAEPESSSSPAVVVLVGDLPDARAEACGVEQPTHKRLWSALHAKVAGAWSAAGASSAANLLRTVERECGVELADRDLRRRMLRIIEHMLIPAVVLERIMRTLQEKLPNVRVIGEGWERVVSKEAILSVHGVGAAAKLVQTPHVSAAVFVGWPDPLTPDLLDAVALGWPVLIHNPGGASLAQSLGGVLQRQQHYERFSGPKELLEQVRTICDDPQPARRRADRARACITEQHSYDARLTTLARELGLNLAEKNA